MYILKTTDGLTVTITRIGNSNNVYLGLDTDNLIACFPTIGAAQAAIEEDEYEQYEYHHSLAIKQRVLVIHPIHTT